MTSVSNFVRLLYVLLQALCVDDTGKYSLLAILKYTFVQLTPEYKITLHIKSSCGITVQRRVNCGNLMNIFIYKNHAAY